MQLLHQRISGIALVLAVVACAERATQYDGPLLRLATGGNVIGTFSTAVRDDHIAVAWFTTVGIDTAVFVSRSIDGGNSFSTEQRISPPGERTMQHPKGAPRVELILDPDGFAQPFLAWTRAFADSSEVVWSSTLDGTTYSKPAVIPGGAGRGARTLLALERDSTDRVVATWSIAPAGTATSPINVWRGSTDGTIPAREFHLAVARFGSAPLAAQASDGRRFRIWTDSGVAPHTVKMQQTAAAADTFGETITLGTGSWPTIAAPSTGPVLIWISDRAGQREINVIRLR